MARFKPRRPRRPRPDDHHDTPPPPAAGETADAADVKDEDEDAAAADAVDSDGLPWNRGGAIRAGIPRVSEIEWTDPELTLASGADHGIESEAQTAVRPPGYADTRTLSTAAASPGTTSPAARPTAAGRRLAALPAALLRGWFRVPLLGYLALFVVLLPLAALAHALATPHVPGRNSPYAIKMAWLYQTHGPLSLRDGRFESAQATPLRDQWADTDYLFHLAAAPFTHGWHEPQARPGTVVAQHGAVALVPAATAAEVEVGDTLRIVAAVGSPTTLGTFTVGEPLPTARRDHVRATLPYLATPPSDAALADGLLMAGEAAAAASVTVPGAGDEPGASGIAEMAASAPLRSGFVLVDEAGNPRGTLLAVDSGYLGFDPPANRDAQPALDRGAALTLLRHGAPVGRLTLGPTLADLDSHVPGLRPTHHVFLVHHLTGHTATAATAAETSRPQPRPLTVDDHRGYLDPHRDDLHEWWRFARHALAADDPAQPSLFAVLAARLPLTGVDTLQQRGKLAAAFFLALFLTVLVYVLRANGVRWPVLAALLIAAGGELFLWRLFVLDVQVLGLALMLLGFHAALHHRRLLLVVLGGVAALAYSAAYVLVLVVGLVWAVQWVAGELRRHEVVLPTWAAVAAGLALGWAVHPNAQHLPQALAVPAVAACAGSFLQPVLAPLGEALGSRWLVRLADEAAGHPSAAAAPQAHALVVALWTLWLPAMLATFGYLARGLRPSLPALVAFGLTAVGGVLGLLVADAVTYLVPVAVLYLAFAARDHWRAIGWDVDRRGRVTLPPPTPDDPRSAAARFFAYRPWRAALLIVPTVGLGLLAVGFGTIGGLRAVQALPPAGHGPGQGVALWMRTHTPADARVFTTEADTFAELFHHHHQARYLVPLDLAFLHVYAPAGRKPGEVFEMWTALCDGATTVVDPSRRDAATGQPFVYRWDEALTDVFLSDYVLCQRSRHALHGRLSAAPRQFEVVYADAHVSLFRVREPRRRPGHAVIGDAPPEGGTDTR